MSFIFTTYKFEVACTLVYVATIYTCMAFLIILRSTKNDHKSVKRDQGTTDFKNLKSRVEEREGVKKCTEFKCKLCYVTQINKWSDHERKRTG